MTARQRKRKAYNAAHVVENAVGHHCRDIRYSTDPKRRGYKGMPFPDEWDHKMGGSYAAGAAAIIAEIGPRPKGKSLHIVVHELGFVLGNLSWATKTTQNSEQMFKIIARQDNRIRKLQLAVQPVNPFVIGSKKVINGPAILAKLQRIMDAESVLA